MAIDFMEFLKEAFDGTDTLNAEQLRKVLQETTAYFEALEAALKSGDAKTRDQAAAYALEVKEFLDSKAGNASKFKGLESFNNEELSMATEINNSLKLGDISKSKIKKLKPIKLS